MAVLDRQVRIEQNPEVYGALTMGLVISIICSPASVGSLTTMVHFPHIRCNHVFSVLDMLDDAYIHDGMRHRFAPHRITRTHCLANLHLQHAVPSND